MAQNGKLKLDLQDVFDKRIQEKVDISLRNLQQSHAPIFRNVDASKSITISDLFTAPQGNYQLVVDPPSYNPVNHCNDQDEWCNRKGDCPSGGHHEDSKCDFP
jgi:hypothetical protein